MVNVTIVNGYPFYYHSLHIHLLLLLLLFYNISSSTTFPLRSSHPAATSSCPRSVLLSSRPTTRIRPWRGVCQGHSVSRAWPFLLFPATRDTECRRSTTLPRKPGREGPERQVSVMKKKQTKMNYN